MAQKFIAMALEAVGALFLVAMGFVLHPAAGFGIAGGALHRAANVLVTVELTDGTRGLGEGAPREQRAAVARGEGGDRGERGDRCVRGRRGPAENRLERGHPLLERSDRAPAQVLAEHRGGGDTYGAGRSTKADRLESPLLDDRADLHLVHAFQARDLGAAQIIKQGGQRLHRFVDFRVRHDQRRGRL